MKPISRARNVPDAPHVHAGELLILSVTQVQRHFDFVLDILPHEGVIFIARRREVVAVLVHPQTGILKRAFEE